ncbi:MAG: class II aldolase/adducin family protein [Candidatus Omnitrophota bacterium]
MKIDRIKKDLARYARRMASDGLTVGSSGNLSARDGKRFFIKSAGCLFEALRPDDFVPLDINCPTVQGLEKVPSCEYRLHAACYRQRSDIRAVFHTHPFFTKLMFSETASARPVTMEYAAYINRAVTCVDFASPGSSALARLIEKACKKHDCIIMKKHGLITLGRGMQEAYLRSLMVEREARARVIKGLLRLKKACFSKRELDMLIGAI